MQFARSLTRQLERTTVAERDYLQQIFTMALCRSEGALPPSHRDLVPSASYAVQSLA